MPNLIIAIDSAKRILGFLSEGKSMKKIIMVAFLAVNLTPIFAGSFFANHLIIDCSMEKVELFVSALDLNVIGIYDAKNPNQYLLCEEVTDTQDLDYGISLAQRLSNNLSSAILYTLVHDSDILYLVLVVDGEVAFKYNSWPGYWEGAKRRPLIENLGGLAGAFQADAEEIQPILDLSIFHDEYIFAEDILESLRRILNISEYIYLGYGYALEAEKEIIDYGFIIRKW